MKSITGEYAAHPGPASLTMLRLDGTPNETQTAVQPLLMSTRPARFTRSAREDHGPCFSAPSASGVKPVHPEMRRTRACAISWAVAAGTCCRLSDVDAIHCRSGPGEYPRFFRACVWSSMTTSSSISRTVSIGQLDTSSDLMADADISCPERARHIDPYCTPKQPSI
jgi:hypothetical protein